jgi:hypothetical protein
MMTEGPPLDHVYILDLTWSHGAQRSSHWLQGQAPKQNTAAWLILLQS